MKLPYQLVESDPAAYGPQEDIEKSIGIPPEPAVRYRSGPPTGCRQFGEIAAPRECSRRGTLRLAVLLPVVLLCLQGVPPGLAQQASKTRRNAAPSAQPKRATSVLLLGPLPFFQRIAAISREAAPEDVLPFLARNVELEGYDDVADKDPKPTEYLKLLLAYLDQAGELQKLAGLEGRIHIEGCQDVQPLLHTLGYHLRGPCGPQTSVETDDAKRAFLTLDSGFPLVDLEEDLRRGNTFDYTFGTATLPVLFNASDWTWTDQDLLSTLLKNPSVARLYWALSRLDSGAANSLRQSVGLRKLVPLAPVLDFYGSHLAVRGGRAVVPGGAAGEAAWKNLVGADPANPSEFLLKLVQKDDGWMAAYFDAISYAPRSEQNYFNDPARLKRFYQALRGKGNLPSAARSVFRPTASLYLLTTRLLLNQNGQPDVPGSLAIWKEIFRRKSETRQVRQWAKQSESWKSPDDLMEALFGISSASVEDSPLEVYLQLIEVDRRRPAGQGLGAPAVRSMAENFSRYHDQFLMFSEFSGLNDDSISSFMSAAQTLDRMPAGMLKADAMGLFQANVGLWQIVARQNQIPPEAWNSSFQQVLQPFAQVHSTDQLFDSARASLDTIWRAAGGSGAASEEGLIALLAGPSQSTPEAERMVRESADRLRSAFEAQRLVSLDTLLRLNDGLLAAAQGKPVSPDLIHMAGALREFELPRPMFSNRERAEWASGLQHNPYTSLAAPADLGKLMAEPKHSAKEWSEARGLLTPFLRDALVGLNYVYYEPPGAQMILNNALLVRSHDFSEQMSAKGDEVWETPRIEGRGWSAAGGAHLVGSMANLPYVLAQLEQDFIVPEHVQSLIWADLVPTVLTSAALPRWWQVSEQELRAAALYQVLGEDLLAASVHDSALRDKVLDFLHDYLLPQRLERLQDELRAGHSDAAIALLTPSESFALGSTFAEHEPGAAEASGEAGKQLAALRRASPEDVSVRRIARDFGVPHPILARTYQREFIAAQPLPTFLGYSSRLMAECWESSNLYWARLAVEKDEPPAALNQLVPVLTRLMVEKIFASNLEDWPALLRAMRETGRQFRTGAIPELQNAQLVAGP